MIFLSEKMLASEEGLYSMEYSTSSLPPESKYGNDLIIRSIWFRCKRLVWQVIRFLNDIVSVEASKEITGCQYTASIQGFERKL
jgi:hypothetical protein